MCVSVYGKVFISHRCQSSILNGSIGALNLCTVVGKCWWKWNWCTHRNGINLAQGKATLHDGIISGWLSHKSIIGLFSSSLIQFANNQIWFSHFREHFPRPSRQLQQICLHSWIIFRTLCYLLVICAQFAIHSFHFFVFSWLATLF